jgi:RHS repeat-associated protein
VNARYEAATIRSGPLALDYTMTPAGDVGAIREGAASASFSYDFRDRLVAFSPGFPAGTDLTNEYAAAFPWGKADRITRSGTFTGTTLTSGYAFDYDYQANLSSIGKVVNGSVRSALCLRHDPLGRLAIVGPGANGGGDGRSCLRDADVAAVHARLRYDSRNRRIARWLASTGEWTYFVHGAAGELLSELRAVSGAWVPVRDYVWLEGRPLAQIEYGSSGERSVYYVHADQLGIPRKLTSSQGVVVWSATTQPYGEVNETVTPDPATGRSVVTNLRLPGQYDERLLGNVGLQGPYYNWNRWYLPGVGRYLELDPVNLEGFLDPQNRSLGPAPDWFGYAKQNPFRYTDRTGEASGPEPANDLGRKACIERGCPATTVCPSDKLLNNTCYLTGCNFGPRGATQSFPFVGECYYQCRDGALPWKNMTRWGPTPTIGCSNKSECRGN